MKLSFFIGLAFVGAVFMGIPQPAEAALGALDTNFTFGTKGHTSTLTRQNDGRILVAGLITEAGGRPRTALARMSADGVLDVDFAPRIALSSGVSDPSVYLVALQADGKIVIGGHFSDVNEVMRTNLARLSANGTLDTSFDPLFEGNPVFSPSSLVLGSDGKIMIGGLFRKVNGVARNGLARLNADGTLDTSYDPVAFARPDPVSVYTLAPLPNGKLLVFGRFINADETYHHYFVRLHPDGTEDNNLKVETDFEVEEMALQADGKILIAGDFTTVWGVQRRGLARLHPDGSLDRSFEPSGDFAQTYAILPLPGGRILLGGGYANEDQIGGGSIDNALVLLSEGGVFDESFHARIKIAGNPLFRGVFRLAPLPDGKILVAGDFTSVNGIPHENVARIEGEPVSDISLCCASVVQGAPGFSITSTAVRTAMVEASTNLTSWTAIQGINIGPAPVRFSDPDQANFPRRFYRVSSP